MAAYKYVSAKSVISKVFRDSGIQTQDWVWDSVEWIGEVLGFIGASVALNDTVKVVKTVSHKTLIPADLKYLQEIRYGYYNSTKTTQPKLEEFTHTLPRENGAQPANLPDENTDLAANYYLSESFYIDGKYIVTSFEADWIAIVYKKFATDEQGFPQVPDTPEVATAMYWYIMMMLSARGEELRNSAFTYEFCEMRYLKYIEQARNDLQMPDESQLKRFAEDWVELIPRYSDVLRNVNDDLTSPIDLLGGSYSGSYSNIYD